MSDITPEAVEQQTSALESVAADLHRDRTERKRSDRRAYWAVVAAVVLGFIDLVGVVLLLVNFSRLNDNTRDLNRIEGISVETRQVAVQFNCAIQSARDHPEWAAPGQQPGEIEAFDICVTEGLRD